MTDTNHNPISDSDWLAAEIDKHRIDRRNQKKATRSRMRMNIVRECRQKAAERLAARFIDDILTFDITGTGIVRNKRICTPTVTIWSEQKLQGEKNIGVNIKLKSQGPYLYISSRHDSNQFDSATIHDMKDPLDEEQESLIFRRTAEFLAKELIAGEIRHRLST